MARTHLDSRIHPGERDRRCDLPHCFSACTRKARGGPIQTIAPAFDGLKVFPSLAGLSIARFGRSHFAGLPTRRCLSPPDFRTFLTVRRVTEHH
jgi:hypothetical protein